MSKKLWYAVTKYSDDCDWGTGSYNYDEAVRMLKAKIIDYPDARIAVIDDGPDPLCVDIITLDDIQF